MPGNPNDRLLLPSEPDAALPLINGQSFLESLGLRGDWRAGEELTVVDAEEEAGGGPSGVRLARLRSAFLSLPCHDGYSRCEREGAGKG